MGSSSAAAAASAGPAGQPDLGQPCTAGQPSIAAPVTPPINIGQSATLPMAGQPASAPVGYASGIPPWTPGVMPGMTAAAFALPIAQPGQQPFLVQSGQPVMFGQTPIMLVPGPAPVPSQPSQPVSSLTLGQMMRFRQLLLQVSHAAHSLDSLCVAAWAGTVEGSLDAVLMAQDRVSGPAEVVLIKKHAVFCRHAGGRGAGWIGGAKHLG